MGLVYLDAVCSNDDKTHDIISQVYESLIISKRPVCKVFFTDKKLIKTVVLKENRLKTAVVCVLKILDTSVDYDCRISLPRKASNSSSSTSSASLSTSSGSRRRPSADCKL